MRFNLLKVLFAIIFSASAWCVSGQSIALTESNQNDQKAIKGELFVGFGSYEGDVLCHDEEHINMFTEAQIAFGVKLRKELLSNLDISFAYYNTKLKGSDALFTSNKGHQLRNFSFSNTIHELSIGCIFEPFRSKGYKLSPFVFGSFGYVFGKSATDYKLGVKDQPTILLINEDINEAKSSSICFPLGLGFVFNINEKMYLTVEGGLRIGLNDYMDGVSLSGNSTINDYYGLGGISLGYFLFNSSNRYINTIKEY